MNNIEIKYGLNKTIIVSDVTSYTYISSVKILFVEFDNLDSYSNNYKKLAKTCSIDFSRNWKTDIGMLININSISSWKIIELEM